MSINERIPQGWAKDQNLNPQSVRCLEAILDLRKEMADYLDGRERIDESFLEYCQKMLGWAIVGGIDIRREAGMVERLAKLLTSRINKSGTGVETVTRFERLLEARRAEG